MWGLVGPGLKGRGLVREMDRCTGKFRASLGAQMVKHPPAMRETWVLSLEQEDPLEKEMATHSSTLAWKIPWTEEPVGYSPWSRKELDMTEQLHFHGAIGYRARDRAREIDGPC